MLKSNLDYTLYNLIKQLINMGINIQSLKTILFEHKYKPFRGNALIIGRSTVTISIEKITELFEEYLSYTPVFSKNEDSTKHSNAEYFVDDIELFQKVSGELSLDVLDISDYEGANIVCDMNQPLPDDLFSRYDIIYDSSVLDNVFNPATFICNVALLLKPNGRYIGLNVNSFFPGAMVSVHPEWFFGFFAINKFKDCKVYLIQTKTPGRNRFEWESDIWLYKPQFTRNPNYDYLKAVMSTNGICHSIVIAEKDDFESRELYFPINLQYLQSSGAVDWASPNFHVFDSNRPLMHGILNANEPDLPHLTDHYTYLGSKF